ncbi:EAL domain-containing protein [Aquibacillus albus]|uniref:Diguanylate cyclase (GGDEF)-like protein/PAS domain S-box-containing protein n=1 Tax=Aquibacillus albus TaxID=1168171 RepID=A0ABS2N535_9BACI|nr:EAL domain-containing protein [Aquibacillus albus]MBM7573224.1 diguanylate cyclase (GGDEF)-like protein/PAS domain S-box-containing protein [Aquibacillus albus]
MNNKRNTLAVLCVLFFLIAFSYTYLFLVKDTNGFLFYLGEFIYSLAPLFAAFWLFGAYQRSPVAERLFWLLLSIGYLFAFTGLMVRDIFELWLHMEVHFPGLPDLFYLLHYVLFSIAFIYKLVKEKENAAFFQNLMDMIIIMTVAITLFGYFIIQPIMQELNASNLYQFVSISYPVGDLFLLLLTITIYYDSPTILKRNGLSFLVLGLFLQVTADAFYLYLQTADGYSSWSVVDPIYFLSYLLVGYAGYQRSKFKLKPIIKSDRKKEDLSLFQIVLPYLYIVGLLVILLFHREDTIVIGASISIFFILFRQVMVMIGSRKLLDKFKQQAEELQTTSQIYQSIFKYHTDTVFSLDLDGNFLLVNPKCVEFAKRSEQELLQMSIFSILPKTVVNQVKRHFLKAREGNPQTNRITYNETPSEVKYLEITYIPIFIDDKVTGVFCIAKDITENKKNEEKINYLAYHDPLTGLVNRRYFDQLLEEAVVEAKAKKQMLAVLFLDLDHFKIINDTLGHNVGDLLLQAVGKRLKEALNKNQVVGRHGGDEFTFLLKGVKDKDDTIDQAEQVFQLLNHPFYINKHKISLTPSIGISIYPDDAHHPEQLMKNADLAMYRVKYHGKNHYRVFTALSEGKSIRKLTIEKDIHTVIRENQLEIFYQPQVESNSGRIIGMEALVRWNHPTLGIISPSEFIPLAEATDIIFAVNEWVLEEACKQQKEWMEQGLHLKLSVNISPQQFYHQSDLTKKVKDIVNTYKIDPTKLVIEITELIAIHNMDIAMEKLLELKSLGIQIALDDFGTGYSSLSYLTRLPIDEIKIAKEFIDTLDEGTENQAILHSLVKLANDLNLRVVIEGVETEEQYKKLHLLSCHIVQGYYFSKPLPAKQVNQLLIEWTTMY